MRSLEKLTWGEFIDDAGRDIMPVGFLPGVGVKVDFGTEKSDRVFDTRLEVGVIYETDVVHGEGLFDTRLVLVMAEVLTDRVRYVLTVEDELHNRDVVERSYWLEENDLVVPQLSGRSRIELGKGYWGLLAAGIVKEIGIDNLYELELD